MGFDPGFERPTCLATLKSSNRTKQSLCGWQHIYIYIAFKSMCIIIIIIIIISRQEETGNEYVFTRLSLVMTQGLKKRAPSENRTHRGLDIYEGWLKSSWADQDTLMEYDHTNYLFRNISTFGPHTSSIGVAGLWSSSSAESIWPSHDVFSQSTFLVIFVIC